MGEGEQVAPRNIYILVLLRKQFFFFSLAPCKGSYLHLKVERYSDLLSKLDSFAFLSSFFFYILIFHSLKRCLIFHPLTRKVFRNYALMERERERERERV